MNNKIIEFHSNANGYRIHTEVRFTHEFTEEEKESLKQVIYGIHGKIIQDRVDNHD